MTIGPQKDEKDDKSPKRWQTLEKMTTDNSEVSETKNTIKATETKNKDKNGLVSNF